jgi:hypothetical protein
MLVTTSVRKLVVAIPLCSNPLLELVTVQMDYVHMRHQVAGVYILRMVMHNLVLQLMHVLIIQVSTLMLPSKLLALVEIKQHVMLILNVELQTQ